MRGDSRNTHRTQRTHCGRASLRLAASSTRRFPAAAASCRFARKLRAMARTSCAMRMHCWLAQGECGTSTPLSVESTASAASAVVTPASCRLPTAGRAPLSPLPPASPCNKLECAAHSLSHLMLHSHLAQLPHSPLDRDSLRPSPPPFHQQPWRPFIQRSAARTRRASWAYAKTPRTTLRTS